MLVHCHPASVKKLPKSLKIPIIINLASHHASVKRLLCWRADRPTVKSPATVKQESLTSTFNLQISSS